LIEPDFSALLDSPLQIVGLDTPDGMPDFADDVVLACAEFGPEDSDEGSHEEQ